MLLITYCAATGNTPSPRSIIRQLGYERDPGGALVAVAREPVRLAARVPAVARPAAPVAALERRVLRGPLAAAVADAAPFQARGRRPPSPLLQGRELGLAPGEVGLLLHDLGPELHLLGAVLDERDDAAPYRFGQARDGQPDLLDLLSNNCPAVARPPQALEGPELARDARDGTGGVVGRREVRRTTSPGA